MLAPALEAAEVLDATVANMRFVKPIDRELILELSREHSLLVSIEENVSIGGAGLKSPACTREHASSTKAFVRIGLPDRFIEHGDQTRLLGENGLRQRRHHSHRTNLSETTGNTMKPAQNEKITIP